MDCSMPGSPVHHQFPELAQTHVHQVSDASNHLILYRPLLLLPLVVPSIRVFSTESVLHIRWPKFWHFNFSISPSNEYSGLISFRMDWLELLEVKGSLKSFLQNHSSKASILDVFHSNFELVHCSMSSSNCCFLICIEITQETCKVVWYSHLFKNFPQFLVIHRVKGFGIVNKAEVDVFLELSCFFYEPTDVGRLISDSPVFSKSNLNIWKFSVHVLLKPGLKDFEHYFASVWGKYNCAVVWTFFGIALIWDWNENWPFPILWPLLNFPNLLVYWVQLFNNIIF